MRLGEFRYLADENIHSHVVAGLRARGVDIVDVDDEAIRGVDDLTLVRHAVSRGRVIVTHDRDCGALAIAQLEPIVGIVYLRPGHIDSHFTLQTWDALVARDLDLTSPFIVVARRTGKHVSVRVRQLS